MSSLTWIRGFNGTIGRIAPRWTAERMRRAFMMPGEWPPKDWELPLLASSGASLCASGCRCCAGARAGSPAAAWLGRQADTVRPSDRATGRRGLFGVCPRCAGPWPLAGQGRRTWCCSPMPCWRPLASCRRCVRWSVIPGWRGGVAGGPDGAAQRSAGDGLGAVADSRTVAPVRSFRRFAGPGSLAFHPPGRASGGHIRGVPGCGALPSGNARTGGACRRRPARSGGKCRAHPCRLAGWSLAAPAGRRPPPTARRAQAERVAAGAARGASGDARLPARGKDGERFLRRVAEGLSLS